MQVQVHEGKITLELDDVRELEHLYSLLRSSPGTYAKVTSSYLGGVLESIENVPSDSVEVALDMMLNCSKT